jgi:hypothetical protein
VKVPFTSSLNARTQIFLLTSSIMNCNNGAMFLSSGQGTDFSLLHNTTVLHQKFLSFHLWNLHLLHLDSSKFYINNELQQRCNVPFIWTRHRFFTLAQHNRSASKIFIFSSLESSSIAPGFIEILMSMSTKTGCLMKTNELLLLYSSQNCKNQPN